MDGPIVDTALSTVSDADVPLALLLAFLGGVTTPIGACLAAWEDVSGFCRRAELDHFLAAFGGGALLAAIALVLVPHGMEKIDVMPVAVSFLLGGLFFWQLDMRLQRSGGAVSMYIATLLDYVPEALALGAAFATGGASGGYLLAALIALQNLPEGFAAWQEMTATGMPRKKLVWMFACAPFFGPVAAFAGISFFAVHEYALKVVMLFASGGILYLLFQDIAPAARLERRYFPALGAILGFLVGIVGTMLTR